MNRPLNRTDLHALTVIDDTVMKGAKVARFDNTLQDVVFGHARYFCRTDSDGGFIGAETDIRDAYLRVTLRSGFEAFWPVRELMDDVTQGQYAAYDW